MVKFVDNFYLLALSSRELLEKKGNYFMMFKGECEGPLNLEGIECREFTTDFKALKSRLLHQRRSYASKLSDEEEILREGLDHISFGYFD